MSDGRLAQEVAINIVFFVDRTWVVTDLHPPPVHSSLDAVVLALLCLNLEVGEWIQLYSSLDCPLRFLRSHHYGRDLSKLSVYNLGKFSAGFFYCMINQFLLLLAVPLESILYSMRNLLYYQS